MGYQKGEKYPGTKIDEDDILKIMETYDKNTVAGSRDRAILAVMYRSGMRIAEALALMPENLDRDQSFIRVLHGKGDKDRTVVMDDGGWSIMGRWLKKRAKISNLPEDAPLFCSPSGKAITQQNFRKVLYIHAKKAGVKARVNPHGFRHSHAFEMASEGIQPHIIQEQLGHASLERTQVYLKHLCPTDVRSALEKRVWAYG